MSARIQQSVTYIRYRDPGHSWLKVPMSEISRLGIAQKISDSSPESEGFQYLEEDCDVAVFMDELRARGEPLPTISLFEIDDFWREVMDVS